jgi:hypothetical protein
MTQIKHLPAGQAGIFTDELKPVLINLIRVIRVQKKSADGGKSKWQSN